MESSSSLRFATAARALGEVARAGGLEVPGFRSPPRIAGVDRTIRRTPRLGRDGRPDPAAGSDVVVSVRIKGRPWVSVLADMIDGVLAANELTGPTAGAARTAMWVAVEGELVQPAEPRGVRRARPAGRRSSITEAA